MSLGHFTKGLAGGLDTGMRLGNRYRKGRDEAKSKKAQDELLGQLRGELFEVDATEPAKPGAVPSLATVGVSGVGRPNGGHPAAAQGVKGPPQPRMKELTPEQYSDVYRRYAAQAALDPDLATAAKPALDFIRQQGMQSYVQGFQGDTSTIAGALEYGEYLGRGSVMFGDVPDQKEVLDRAKTADTSQRAWHNQDSLDRSRQDASAARWARIDQAGQKEQDPGKQIEQARKARESLFLLLHAGDTENARKQAAAMGINIDNIRESFVTTPTGEQVPTYEFEILDESGKIIGTSNAYEQAMRHGSLSQQEDYYASPKSKAASDKPDPVVKTFRGLFSEPWMMRAKNDDARLELLNLGDAYAADLKSQGMPDHKAASEAKSRVIRAEARIAALQRTGADVDIMSAWDNPDGEGGEDLPAWMFKP
ncbi:MAG: hypothetical protein EOM22_00235 [Gammaproteobacteria bacterium]|nr:hypothetical protein [Gammaproteobacteria bacterium]